MMRKSKTQLAVVLVACALSSGCDLLQQIAEGLAIAASGPRIAWVLDDPTLNTVKVGSLTASDTALVIASTSLELGWARIFGPEFSGTQEYVAADFVEELVDAIDAGFFVMNAGSGDLELFVTDNFAASAIAGDCDVSALEAQAQAEVDAFAEQIFEGEPDPPELVAGYELFDFFENTFHFSGWVSHTSLAARAAQAVMYTAEFPSGSVEEVSEGQLVYHFVFERQSDATWAITECQTESYDVLPPQAQTRDISLNASQQITLDGAVLMGIDGSPVESQPVGTVIGPHM